MFILRDLGVWRLTGCERQALSGIGQPGAEAVIFELCLGLNPPAKSFEFNPAGSILLWHGNCNNMA